MTAAAPPSIHRPALVALVLIAALACDAQRQPPDALPAPADPMPIDDGTGAVPVEADAGSSYGPSPESIPELGGGPEDRLGRPQTALPIEGPVASLPVEKSEQGPWIARRTAGRSGPRDGLAARGAATPDGFGLSGEGMGGGGLGVGAADLGSFSTKGRGSGSAGGYGAPPPAAAPFGPPKSARGDSDRAEESARATQAAPQLRAGQTDDNADFDDYLRYIADWQGAAGPAGSLDRLDVHGQRRVRVLDAQGAPLPGAQVDVLQVNAGRATWTATTMGDGSAAYYPALQVPGVGTAPGGAPEAVGLTVIASYEGQQVRGAWAPGATELVLQLPVRRAARGPVPIDVCFIIDTTGSMADEIARVQETLLSVTQRLRQQGAVDLRYGAVLYRDVGDEYLTLQHPFTQDIQAFDRAVQEIQAGGGGDGPESLNQGLAVGIGQMDWRPGAAKVAFLIADAPPHMDYQEAVTYGRAAAGAVYRGVRVHTVAASGLDQAGSAVFRQIAQLTHGRFIFIEYGDVAASARGHGVTGEVSANNLDQIIYERIHAEQVGWRGGAERLAVGR